MSLESYKAVAMQNSSDPKKRTIEPITRKCNNQKISVVLSGCPNDLVVDEHAESRTAGDTLAD